MGKRSGITKGGRVMNPADRERKQQRAKELKRNKKQRTAVRQAIVKSRDPDEIIEQMNRLDEQEFDPHRQLSINVIQEKRNKLRGSYYQIVNLFRQEKEEKKVKNLEKMMFDYELDRAKKEENFRAMLFSQTENFEEIPLPFGASAPDAASTPFLANITGGIGPQMPAQLQVAIKAGILKKTVSTSKRRKHKYPPGPPPGLPPILFESDEEEEENDDDEEEEKRRREESGKRRRVRFGEPPPRREDGDKEVDNDENEQEEENDEEDYAPVEIPESMLADGGPPLPPKHHQPVYSRPVPSLAAPPIGSAPIMPGMAPPLPRYPPGYLLPPPGMLPPPGELGMRRQHPPPPLQPPAHQSKIGLVGNANYPPTDPHPSAVISAEPQVNRPKVDLPPAEPVISAGPQMRNVKKETTRFVPTAVKIQRPVVPPVVGPRIPTSSVAGPTKLIPKSLGKPSQKQPSFPYGATTGPVKSVDEACDDFLKELDGLL